jgi:hypothetical protein
MSWPRTTKTGLVIPCTENAYHYIHENWRDTSVTITGWGGTFVGDLRDSEAVARLMGDLEVASQRVGWSLRACEKAVNRFIQNRLHV